MYLFLLPLLFGFAFNSASAFTTYYSRHLGERGGRLASVILRDVIGIPVWVIGYAMAARAESPWLFEPNLLTKLIAWLLVLAGGSIIITGIVSIRWRAAAPSIHDSLVERGIYAHIRHPLYSGMILELAGLLTWIPSLAMLAACSTGVLWVMLQARLEEMDLVLRLPAYKEYMQRVPRFLPRLRR